MSHQQKLLDPRAYKLSPEESQFLEEVQANRRLSDTAINETNCVTKKLVSEFRNTNSDELSIIIDIAARYQVKLPY